MSATICHFSVGNVNSYLRWRGGRKTEVAGMVFFPPPSLEILSEFF